MSAFTQLQPQLSYAYISTIVHQGKVLLLTITQDAKVYYAIKKDDDTWTEAKPLILPALSTPEDASVVARQQANDPVKAIYTDTQASTAVAPVKAVSDGEHLYVFRQSKMGSLYVNRYVFDMVSNVLKPKVEIRFKGSGQKYVSLKIDSLGYRKEGSKGDNGFFLEPTFELTGIQNLQTGWYAPLLLPTSTPEEQRWQIFAYNSLTEKIDIVSLRHSKDMPFDLSDRQITYATDDGQEQQRLVPGLIKRSLKLANIKVWGAMNASLYAKQEPVVGDDGQSFFAKRGQRVMLVIGTAEPNAPFGSPSTASVLSFSISKDGTLAELNEQPILTLLRKDAQEILLLQNHLSTVEARNGDRVVLANPGNVFGTSLAYNLAHRFEDGSSVSEYRTQAVFPVQRGANYSESFEFRGDRPINAIDFSFWGQDAQGATTGQARISAQIESLKDGWQRATATYVISQAMTQMRVIGFYAPAGDWNTIELRNAKLEKRTSTFTQAIVEESVSLTTIGSLFPGLDGQHYSATQIGGQNYEDAFLSTLQSFKQQDLSMPTLNTDTSGLKIQGAKLGFAQCLFDNQNHSFALTESGEGTVQLQFMGVRSLMRCPAYDTVTERWVVDLPETALRFDGSQSYVEIQDPFRPGQTDFTISLWAATKSKDGTYHGLLGKQGDQFRKPSLWVTSDGLGMHYDSYDPLGNRFTDVIPNVFNGEGMTHITWVKKGTEYRFYRYGRLIATKPAPSTCYRANSSYWIGKVDNVWKGQIDEVCIWEKALSQDQIQVHMNQRLSGHEPGLVGYWSFDDINSSQAHDTSATQNHGTLHNVTWSAASTPMGGHSFEPLFEASVLGVIPAEYGCMMKEKNSDRRFALLWRCYSYLLPTGNVYMLTGQRVGELEQQFVGNMQIEPTLIGYIEGAPPIPSENLTLQDSYQGISSVQLQEAQTITRTWSSSREDAVQTSLHTAIGASLKTSVGIGVEVESEFEALAEFNLDYSAGTLKASSASSAVTVNFSDSLKLFGYKEPENIPPQNPAVGHRFIPKNVGYALLTSAVADVFILKMKGSGSMIAYQIMPNSDIPPDTNIVTFNINPAYQLNGSLDGQVGSQSADRDFYRAAPQMRSQYGSSYPASYLKVKEAYALENKIKQQDLGREAYYTQYNPNVFQDIPALQSISKRNIVNTYVWDADGGMRSVTESFSNVQETSIGGSYNLGIMAGLTTSLKGSGIGFELEVLGGTSLNLSSMKTQTSETAFNLDVVVDCEGSGVTDYRDRPLLPGEKVSRYRFKTYYLEPDADHFDSFFDEVIDPEWLMSNREEAITLRLARNKRNRTWRVLHRVTHIERPASFGVGTQDSAITA